VAFIWVPSDARGIKQELLENRTYFKDIKDLMEDEINDIKHNMPGVTDVVVHIEPL